MLHRLDPSTFHTCKPFLHLHLMFTSTKLILLDAALCNYHKCCIVSSLTSRTCGQKEQRDLKEPVQIIPGSNKAELIPSVRTKLPVSVNSTSQEHQFQEGLLAQTHEKTHGVRPEPVLCQSKQAFLERRAPAKPALMAYL